MEIETIRELIEVCMVIGAGISLEKFVDSGYTRGTMANICIMFVLNLFIMLFK